MGLFDWFKRSPPGRDEFAKMYEKYLRDRRLVGKVQYDAAEFVFRVEGGGVSTMGLHNIYRDYCRAAAGERQELLRRYSEVLKRQEVPEGWAAVRGQLMPTIRTAAQIHVMRLSQLADEGHCKGYDNFLFRPFSEDALSMIAHDRPDTIALVNKDTAEKWGVSFEEAWQACLDNLRDCSPQKTVRLDNGVIQCLWDDAYDSSRILLPDLLSRSGAGNDPVIMIPTRGCLLLAPAANREAQLRMVDYAQESIGSHGRFVSALMYRYSGNTLNAWAPADAAIGQKLHNLRTRELIAMYGEQHASLEKWDKREGRDLFRANFLVYENKAKGRLFSVASVSEGVQGTIPKADIIAFGKRNPSGEGHHDAKLVSWDHAMAIAGDCFVKEEPGYPPLYRIAGFPAYDKLDAAPAGLEE